MKTLFFFTATLLLTLTLQQSIYGQGSNGNIIPPPVNTTPLSNQTICSGLTAVLSASGLGQISWYDAEFQGNMLGSGNSFTTPVLNTSKTFWAQDNTSLTSSRTAIPVTVNLSPEIATTASSNAICNGNAVTITATGSDIGQYNWLPDVDHDSTITVSPFSTTTYTVIGTNSNGCTGVATQTIDVTTCSISYTVKFYLQAFYLNSGFMNDALMNQQVPGATSTMTDTVTIQLRSSIAPYEVMYTYKTMLYTNGNATITVPSVGSYYIVVEQRNGLETWSSEPITPGLLSTSYNFSSSQNKAYGDNQVELQPGIWGIFAGDLIPDGNIDLLDLQGMEEAIVNFDAGYLMADINGDGNVDLLDTPLINENIRHFVYSIHP